MACFKDALASINLPMMIGTDYICLKPSFNEPLENYHHIIRHVDRIMFYRTDKNNYTLHDMRVIPYYFPITLTKNIKVLFLPDNFNNNVVLSKNTIYLWVGCHYTGSLVLPKKFKSLIVGNKYNKHLTLTKCFKRLIMGESYNSYVFITKNMLHLSIGDNYNHKLVLPKNLVRLEISLFASFNQQIILPKKLKIFKPNHKCNTTSNLIEYSLENVYIPIYPTMIRKFDYSIFRIYDNLPNGPTNYILPRFCKDFYLNIPSNCKNSNQKIRDCSFPYMFDYNFEYV